MSSKKKYDSLISMVESEVFTMEMLIHHLRDNYDADGIRDILVNRLYKYADNEALFYVPELW